MAEATGEVADGGAMQRVMVAKGPRARAQLSRDYARDRDYLTAPNQPPLPDWLQIRDHQLDATEQVVKEYEGGARVVFLDAPTGCLSGETEMVYNRGGCARRTSLQNLYEKFHGRIDSGHSWDPSIPTLIPRGDMGSMTLRSGRVRDVMLSGLRETILIYVWDDKRLRLTPDHRVMTSDGWAEAGSLSRGQQVLVNVGRRKRSTQAPKPYYPQWGGLRGHPRARNPGHPKSGWVVPRHIVVMDAYFNDLPVEEFVTRLRAGESDFHFISDNMHVHHRDLDTTNYALDNLTVLTATEHAQFHADHSRVAEQLGYRAIERVTPGGMALTFDIEMEGEPHFMANGIYVHNSGKTIMADLVRRRMGVERGLYVCTTRSLQEQVARDFSYARVLKGRANYTPTQLSRQERGYEGGGRWGGVAVTCGDCDRGPRDAPIEEQSCSYCEVLDCPYLRARYEASVAPVGVLNTAFMLTHLNGGGGRAPSPFRDRELVVADEIDTTEDELLGYVEFRLGSGVAATLGVEVPKKGSHMTTIRAWLGEEVIAAIERARGQIRGGGLEVARQRRRLDQLMQDARRVIEREEGWVREGEEEGNARGGGNALVLKPVEVSDVGDRYLWQHGQRWLCMSGTVVSADTLADSLGLTEAEVPWAVVELPMRFPVEHRKVVFMPAGSMTRKGQEQGDAAKVFDALDRVLAQHPIGNVLVHTFSYQLARDVANHLGNYDPSGRCVITYATAHDRDQALATFKRAVDPNGYARGKGAVLVASSMGRGIDLPGDLCRVQVILKMPHASLGSRQVSERLRVPGGQDWYLANTVRTIMQQCGRAVRGDEDWATTYILDASFSKVLKDGKRRGMFPRWWLDALSLGRLR